jgi:hypothetical protein
MMLALSGTGVRFRAAYLVQRLRPSEELAPAQGRIAIEIVAGAKREIKGILPLSAC